MGPWRSGHHPTPAPRCASYRTALHTAQACRHAAAGWHLPVLVFKPPACACHHAITLDGTLSAMSVLLPACCRAGGGERPCRRLHRQDVCVLRCAAQPLPGRSQGPGAQPRRACHRYSAPAQPSSSRAQQPACACSDALLFVQLHCRCSCCGELISKDLLISRSGGLLGGGAAAVGAGDVSGKTSFLVVGDQCSRRKFLKVGGWCRLPRLQHAMQQCGIVRCRQSARIGAKAWCSCCCIRPTVWHWWHGPSVSMYSALPACLPIRLRRRTAR